MPDYGIPLTVATPSNPRREPAKVDRDNFYGLENRDFRESTTDAGTLRLEHDLNENLTVSNTTRIARTTLDYIVTNPDDSRGNVPNGLVSRSAKSRNSNTQSWVNQTDLTARFDTGSIEHILVTGVEISDVGVHNRPYVVTPGTGNNTCTPAHLASGDCTSLSNPSPKDAWTGSIARSTPSRRTWWCHSAMPAWPRIMANSRYWAVT
jgi:catecholate siderophore receptor